MAIESKAFREATAAYFAALPLEPTEAILIDHDGARTSHVIQVRRAPDGEHAGEPIWFDWGTATRPAAMEFDGHRFEPNDDGLWIEA